MSTFVIGNIFLIVSLVVTCGAQLVLKGLMNKVGSLEPSWTFVHATFFAEGRFWLWAIAGTMVVASFVCWLLCLKYLALSYAFTMSAAVVALMTFLSAIVLREQVTVWMYLGAVCVAVGMALVVRPPQQGTDGSPGGPAELPCAKDAPDSRPGAAALGG